MRICSFLPSATEIVYALGLGDSLLGVSHECDYPPEARTKPRVVRSKFDPASHSSREIDRLVADLVSRAERIYEVDLAVLKEARPDLVITQELCEVCAVSYQDVERAVVQLDLPPQLLSLDPHGLTSVLDDIERVGRSTGRDAEARRLTEALRGRIDGVRSKAAEAQSKPRVACIEWLDPLIVAGHWIPEMVGLAGGLDGLAQPGTPSRRIDIEELRRYAPEVVILMPCGMDVERALSEFTSLEGLDRWKTLPAFVAGDVYAVDAGSLFSRSGPRLVDGLELMAQMIHREIFPSPLPPEAARRLEPLAVPD